MKLITRLKRNIKEIKWNIVEYYKKKEHIIIPIKNKIILVVRILFFVIFYLYILSKLNILSVSLRPWNFISFNDVEYSDIFKDLVISQISITFLTTAILSLISSIEDKHILGEKTTKILFGKYLLKFYMPMFLLYFFMIINIVLIINKENLSALVSFFILSIFILIYIITKVGSIFVSTKKYVFDIYSRYYKECEKNIIRSIPPKDYDSILLSNLKEETIKLISNNDVSYMKNITMYECLIDRLLFNIPTDVQQYHLQMIYAPSIINDFIEIIKNFIHFKDYVRAIQCYNWLLSRFNYHNLYIPYSDMNSIFPTLCNKILDYNNEFEVLDYLDWLSPIVTNIEIQQHFALTDDYSKVNLHNDLKDFKYHYDSKYFEILYEKVFLNKYLTEPEKDNCYTRLFDIFRLSAHNGCNIIRDITNYSFEFKAVKERKMPACIVGQATALLLIKTLLYKDERNFKFFLQININAEERRFAVHNILLGIMNIESLKDEKNLYCRFHGLDLDYCKQTLEKNITLLFEYTDTWFKEPAIQYIQNDYDYIKRICDRDNKKDELFFDPIIRYDKELIEQYFKTISKKYKKELKTENKKEKNYKKK